MHDHFDLCKLQAMIDDKLKVFEKRLVYLYRRVGSSVNADISVEVEKVMKRITDSVSVALNAETGARSSQASTAALYNSLKQEIEVANNAFEKALQSVQDSTLAKQNSELAQAQANEALAIVNDILARVESSEIPTIEDCKALFATIAQLTVVETTANEAHSRSVDALTAASDAASVAQAAVNVANAATSAAETVQAAQQALETNLSENYITAAEAREEFAPNADYLTEAEADTIYQEKGDYITTAVADGRYAPIDIAGEDGIDLSHYLTKEEAEETYHPKDDCVRTVNSYNGEVILSYEDVGAAPAGFGLGKSVATTWEEIDNITKPGWYHISGANTIDGYSANYWYMLVAAFGEGTAQVRQQLYAVDSMSYALVRVKHSGTWREWEWVNPPMITGQEYRTTDRWYDCAVYRKAINCGLSANEKTVSYDVTAKRMKSVCVSFGMRPVPQVPNGSTPNNSNIYAAFQANDTSLTLYCGEGWANLATYSYLEYIKA